MLITSMRQEVATPSSLWHTHDCEGGEVGVFTDDVTLSILSSNLMKAFHWPDLFRSPPNSSHGKRSQTVIEKIDHHYKQALIHYSKSKSLTKWALRAGYRGNDVCHSSVCHH